MTIKGALCLALVVFLLGAGVGWWFGHPQAPASLPAKLPTEVLKPTVVPKLEPKLAPASPQIRTIERVQLVTKEVPIPVETIKWLDRPAANPHIRVEFDAEKYVAREGVGWRGQGRCIATDSSGDSSMLASAPLDLFASRAELTPEGLPQALAAPQSRWSVTLGVGVGLTSQARSSVYTVGLDRRLGSAPLHASLSLQRYQSTLAGPALGLTLGLRLELPRKRR